MSTTQKMPPPRTIWMRYTDNTGKRYVAEHTVWDKDLFLAARQDDAAVERSKATKGGFTPLCKAEQITEEQYRAER